MKNNSLAIPADFSKSQKSFTGLMRYLFCFVALATTACGSLQHKEAAQKAGAEFFINGLGMKMTRIPAGTFVMGNSSSLEEMKKLYPEHEEKRLIDLADEYPAHTVNITKSFYMGSHEVTVGQFRKFLSISGYIPESIADGTGGYGYNPNYDPRTTSRGDAFEGRDPKYSWANPGFTQTEEHPVVNVTWNDAQALTKWLTKTEGHTYRLPTEAEWEYACRAGSKTQYYGGDEKSSLIGAANIFDIDAAKNWPNWQQFSLPVHDGFAFTAPAGNFAPNAFGLYDMHGNVWEWTNDFHDEKYYSNSPVNDPKGPVEGDVRVRRGGSWHTWPLYARCSYRNWNSETTRYTLVGIRLVMETGK
jgi:formylglycine-generating enzyme required for sulfatase activity